MILIPLVAIQVFITAALYSYMKMIEASEE